MQEVANHTHWKFHEGLPPDIKMSRKKVDEDLLRGEGPKFPEARDETHIADEDIEEVVDISKAREIAYKVENIHNGEFTSADVKNLPQEIANLPERELIGLIEDGKQTVQTIGRIIEQKYKGTVPSKHTIEAICHTYALGFSTLIRRYEEVFIQDIAWTRELLVGNEEDVGLMNDTLSTAILEDTLKNNDIDQFYTYLPHTSAKVIARYILRDPQENLELLRYAIPDRMSKTDNPLLVKEINEETGETEITENDFWLQTLEKVGDTINILRHTSSITREEIAKLFPPINHPDGTTTDVLGRIKDREIPEQQNIQSLMEQVYRNLIQKKGNTVEHTKLLEQILEKLKNTYPEIIGDFFAGVTYNKDGEINEEKESNLRIQTKKKLFLKKLLAQSTADDIFGKRRTDEAFEAISDDVQKKLHIA